MEIQAYFQDLVKKIVTIVSNPDVQHFKFNSPNTPLSTVQELFIGLLIYGLMLAGLRTVMKSRKEFKLKTAFMVHNMFLSAGSLVLLVALLNSLVPRIIQHGWIWSLCSPEVWDDKRLEFYYYINYLFKYYEWMDTIFLLLKKKPLSFLHVYHHALTTILCFTQLRGGAAMQWVIISLNLFVHVLMYYYYAVAALGSTVWWKKHLTTLQIIQFIVGTSTGYFCLAVHLGYLPEHHQCVIGDTTHAWFAEILLNSYLLLFIDFFWKTYTQKKTTKAE